MKIEKELEVNNDEQLRQVLEKIREDVKNSK